MRLLRRIRSYFRPFELTGNWLPIDEKELFEDLTYGQRDGRESFRDKPKPPRAA